MFIIVKHKSVIEAIPAAWAVFDPDTQNEIVYWPRNSLKAKRFDCSCIPDVNDAKEWFAGKEKVIKRNFETFEEANAEADRLLNSDSGTSESENDLSKRFTRQNQHSLNLVDRKIVLPTKVYSVPPNRLVASTHMQEMSSENFTQSSQSIHSTTPTTAEADQQSDENYGNEIPSAETYISNDVTGDNLVVVMPDGSYQPLKALDYNGLQYQHFRSHQITTPAVQETTAQPNVQDILYDLYPARNIIQGRDRAADVLLPSSEQTINNAGDQSIINILTKLTNQVVTLQQGMQLLLAGKSDGAGKCTKCYHCNPSLMNDSQSIEFEKIKSEDALTNLECMLLDKDYKQKFIKYCLNIIGTERKKDELGTCCLELSREIFDKTFWSQTTWLGTTQAGGTKFSLCKHETFLNFFKFLICQTTSSTPPKHFFSQFFQGRAKNCSQQLKANDSRHPGQRKRAQISASGRPGSKMIKPHDQNMDDNDLDVEECGKSNNEN